MQIYGYDFTSRYGTPLHKMSAKENEVEFDVIYGKDRMLTYRFGVEQELVATTVENLREVYKSLSEKREGLFEFPSTIVISTDAGYLFMSPLGASQCRLYSKELELLEERVPITLTQSMVRL